MLENTHLYSKGEINKNVWLLLHVYLRFHSAAVSKVLKSQMGFEGQSLIGYSAADPDTFRGAESKNRSESCDDIYMLIPQGAPTRALPRRKAAFLLT